MADYDWQNISQELVRLLHLRLTPVAMKLFDNEEEMLAIPKIRRPKVSHTICQILGQAARANLTVGVTEKDLLTLVCKGTLGFISREEMLAGGHLCPSWFGRSEDGDRHQQLLRYVNGKTKAVAVSPITTNRIPNPDVVILYPNPAQAMLLMSAWQYRDYEPFVITYAGDTACSDSWVKTITTSAPAVTFPTYPERKFGGVEDSEVIMTLKPEHFDKLLEGLSQLNKYGLRYPINYYGIDRDICDAGLPFPENVVYPEKWLKKQKILKENDLL